ncbi:MAG: hypothetical protein Q7S66_03350 [bacterium]|nr:hypothetical protein [bacterium]
MTVEQHIAHRGKWEGQNSPNSFETFRLYGEGVEADVMLLNDGKTLAVGHPGDWGAKDAFVESMSPEEFAKLKVNSDGKADGAAPFFTEYVAGCYDRGIQPTFEIKGSNTEAAVRVARLIIEKLKDMQAEGAFKVRGEEHPELLEQMGLHSMTVEAVAEAKQAMEETGLRLKLGFSWLSSLEHTRADPVAASAERFHREGDSWESSGLRAAKELGCDYVFLVEPSKITDELVAEAHGLGLELYIFIRATDNTPALRAKLLAMKVDKLLY